MKYRHRYSIQAPSFFVAQFHTKSANLGLITPPWLPVRHRETPETLSEGSRIDFTLWLGPLPIRWEALIEGISAEGYSDRMTSGPFRSWIHKHSFFPKGDDRTEVVDEIEFTFRRHIFWGPVGVFFALGLPLLFAHRGRKTKRLLETDEVSTGETRAKET
jgi:ligand-binding SRPBCC domain-containing protein